MLSVERTLKDAKIYFNRREFEQFILPLVKALEEQCGLQTREKVRGILNNIITSSMTYLKANTESIDDKEYVELSTIEETINKELQNYSI
jgi:hypothetical protein